MMVNTYQELKDNYCLFFLNFFVYNNSGDYMKKRQMDKSIKVLCALAVMAIVFVIFLPNIMNLFTSIPSSIKATNDTSPNSYSCICDACDNAFHSEADGYKIYQEAIYYLNEAKSIESAVVTKNYRFTDPTYYNNYKSKIVTTSNDDSYELVVTYDDVNYVITVTTTINDVKAYHKNIVTTFPLNYNNLLKWTEKQECTSK